MAAERRKLSDECIKESLKREYICNVNQSGEVYTNKGPTFGVRHQQMILLFLLILLIYSMRVNLSVAIVAMTDPTASSNPDIPTYNWTDKSVVLSAFFWGYIIPQVGAGWLGNVFGPKWFLVGTMFVGSSFAIMTPVFAQIFGSKGVMAIRALQGFTQGFVYPSVHGLLSKWVPLSERSRSGAFVYSAGPLGTVISMSLSGLLASSSYGWPMIFYLFGAVGILWSLLFTLCGCNKPEDHSTISQEEKLFILLCSGTTSGKKKITTPWLNIFTSVPVWAIILTQSGYNWGYWTLMTQTPIYLKNIMKFDIKSNSLFSSLPYLALWVSSIAISFSSDILINKKVLSIGVARKTYNTLGFIIPSIALIYLGKYDSSSSTNSVVLIIVAVSGTSFLKCGYLINFLDIAPNHASVLMGIANCLANSTGILAPLVVQFIVTDETDTSQWKTIFFIAASVNMAACVIFDCFSSGNVQSWNYSQKDEEEVVSKEQLLLARKGSSLV